MNKKLLFRWNYWGDTFKKHRFNHGLSFFAISFKNFTYQVKLSKPNYRKNFTLTVFGDEHGKITAREGVALPKLGEVLELVVAHCDPTINLFDHFYITQNDIVIDRWDIDLRGKAQ